MSYLNGLVSKSFPKLASIEQFSRQTCGLYESKFSFNNIALPLKKQNFVKTIFNWNESGSKPDQALRVKLSKKSNQNIWEINDSCRLKQIFRY